MRKRKREKRKIRNKRRKIRIIRRRNNKAKKVRKRLTNSLGNNPKSPRPIKNPD